MKNQLKEWTYLIVVLSLLLLATSQSHAARKLSNKQKLVIIKTAQEYGLSPSKLIKIAWVESNFKMDAVRYNANGTVDVGLFQINSIHVNGACSMLDISSLEGNVKCAAILLTEHRKHKDTDSMWVARYHSRTPSLKAKYYNKLQNIPPFVLAQIDHN